VPAVLVALALEEAVEKLVEVLVVILYLQVLSLEEVPVGTQVVFPPMVV
jgi:hypothetical protein